MKVLQINIFGNLSTGRIAVDLYRTLVKEGNEGVVAFARNSIADDVPYIKIGNIANIYLDGILTRLTDKAGFYSKLATKRLIKDIEEYDPDIIHLHNLHGYYINIEILFDYLKRCGKPVVWTLHDCWAFTGHCCYYSACGCEKWKTQCFNCPQLKSYPSSFADNSKWNYKRKRELFTSLPKLQLVTVSEWLEEEVKKSFLKDIPCTTIYNGIDLSVFKPTTSTFREKYRMENKKIILGVASTWTERKGLNDFVKLSGLLDDSYKIVLVGLSKDQIKSIPSNIIGIERTNSLEELAELYTMADVFFNASVEETFGLPSVEALGCGTPVIVYNATALPEVCSNGCGHVVEAHDYETLVKIIKEVCDVKKDVENCQTEATAFDKNRQFKKYIELYNNVLKTVRSK